MNLWRKIMVGALVAFSWVKSAFARYEGATFSTQRSIIPGSLTTGRYDISQHSREEIARKVIYFDHNNPLLQALAGKFENFVVGTNPQITPQSSDPDWNTASKADWDEWCKFCDIASLLGFGTQMGLVARTWFEQGDCFIILTQGERRNGKVFPRIQIIEGIRCKTPPWLARDKNVIDGIRIDGNGRPVEYYFAHEVAPGKLEWDPPFASDSVIHIFEPSRPGQLRGMSFFHSVINELHDLDDLHILEMQAARKNAADATWIKTATGELPTAMAQRAARLRGTEGVTTNTGATASQARSEYYQTIGGASVKVLQHGDEVSQNPGQRPSVTTVEYWKLKRELVCAGVEIPYIIVFPDSMQGTVYRGALDMATVFFRSRHAVMAEVMRRIWEYVMRFRIATEKALVNAPADWRKVGIVPPRAPNVDVGRNDAAESQALKEGRTTYEQIYGSRGMDWREALRQRNEEQKFIQDECAELYELICADNGIGAMPTQLPASRQKVITE